MPIWCSMPDCCSEDGAESKGKALNLLCIYVPKLTFGHHEIWVWPKGQDCKYKWSKWVSSVWLDAHSVTGWGVSVTLNSFHVERSSWFDSDLCSGCFLEVFWTRRTLWRHSLFLWPKNISGSLTLARGGVQLCVDRSDCCLHDLTSNTEEENGCILQIST